MKALFFDLEVVKNNISKYTPIITDKNMYIFMYNRSYFAYNLCTCYFYELKRDDRGCFYIVKTLNNYIPVQVYSWYWIKEKITNRVIDSNKKLIVDFSVYSCTAKQ